MAEDHPTLCLNMIVKNESKIIQRLLDSVVNNIHCYCICDTGSTDNTIELITSFFKKHNIPGKVVEEPFQNFEYNRNFALTGCEGMSDYILLLDADMVLQGNTFSLKNCNADAFYIFQGTDSFYYKNIRIVKNNSLFKYRGVTHEYIDCPPNSQIHLIPKSDLFIHDIGDGGSKQNKFERDIDLLKSSLEKNPNDLPDRYNFYLANSYKDCGKWEEAIETYKKRIDIGGWDQEVWNSYYEIGKCYKALGKTNDALCYWLLAHDFYPKRLESLCEIITHYRIEGKHKLCHLFYEKAKQILSTLTMKEIEDSLFFKSDVYKYQLYFEYTIFAAYLGVKNIKDEVITVLNNCNDEHSMTNLIMNMKFYNFVLDYKRKYNMDKKLSANVGEENHDFVSSSLCIIPNGQGFIVNQRFVNYYIRKKDGGFFPFKNYSVATINKYITLSSTFDILETKLFITPYVENLNVMGIEDLKIFQDKPSGKLLFTGTIKHSTDTLPQIGVGIYDTTLDVLEPIHIKPAFTEYQCEKNWVYFTYKESTHMIYSWYPLKICKLDMELQTLELVETRTMPGYFKRVRGSTCGFSYGNEIWFITHFISYENLRDYYHMFVVFDSNMRLLRYSAPFKFEGKPIEFCIGLIVTETDVIASYSTWDETSNIAVYDKEYINSLAKYIN